SEVLIVVCEAKTDDAAALAEAIKRHLAAEFSISCKEVVVLGPGQLPKTSSGKVQRQKTRSMYLAGDLHDAGVRTMGTSAARANVAKYLLRSLRHKVSHRMKQWVGQYWRPDGASNTEDRA